MDYLHNSEKFGIYLKYIYNNKIIRQHFNNIIPLIKNCLNLFPKIFNNLSMMEQLLNQFRILKRPDLSLALFEITNCHHNSVSSSVISLLLLTLIENCRLKQAKYWLDRLISDYPMLSNHITHDFFHII